MGSCCSKTPKPYKSTSRYEAAKSNHNQIEKDEPKISGKEIPKMTSDVKNERSLTIKCKNPKFEMILKYKSRIPLYDLRDRISKKNPDIDLSRYSIHKGNIEILDQTATLKEAGIASGDILSLKKIKELQFPTIGAQNFRMHQSFNSISLDNNTKEFENEIFSNQIALEEIVEEETTKHDVLDHNLKPVHKRNSAKNL